MAPTPGPQEGGCRRLGTVSGRLWSFLLFASSWCLSLPQVRSSLGTNILSAVAAFAGTAILLMDFGVTNWVRWQMSRGVLNLEGWMIRAAGRTREDPIVGSPGPFPEPAAPIDLTRVLTPWPYPKIGCGGKGDEAW